MVPALLLDHRRKIYETNPRGYSCRRGRSRAVRMACAYGAGSRAPFRAGPYHGLRHDSQAAMGNSSRRASAGRRGRWWSGSPQIRWSYG